MFNRNKGYENRLAKLEKEVLPSEKKNQHVNYNPYSFIWGWASGFGPGTLIDRVVELEAEVAKSRDRFTALLKHLNLEYYKKEIKETNGHTTEKVVEGFRKPKKEKKKKKEDDYDEED